MFIRLVFLQCLFLLTAHSWEIPQQTKQLVVGTSASWSSSHVSLTFYEKSAGKWRQIGSSWPGRLGKNGLAWGRGLHPHHTKPSSKREGDGKAPAGVFSLRAAYGIHPSISKNRHLTYHQISSRDLWVEDSKSKFYNRHLKLDHQPSSEWEKKAQMRQNDYPHSLKLAIAHNEASSRLKAIPYAGSAIFFHIWRRNGQSATAGCTTMSETKLRQLIARLNPQLTPLYVLLPKSEYQRLKPQWKLP